MTYPCAFCGEENEIFVDPSAGRRQTFTEDWRGLLSAQPHHPGPSKEDGDVRLQVTQECEA